MPASGSAGLKRAAGSEETWALGLGNDETFWLVQIATAAAQGAWLTGDPDLVDERVFTTYRRGVGTDPWMVGELTAWLLRLGHDVVPAPGLPGPYAAEVTGDHLEAARRWRELGCPFEEAVALTWAGDVESRRRAVELFASTGAAPAEQHVRRLLEAEGVRVATRRGPRASTRQPPAGLTSREAEVLEVLREGLTNAEIAQRLFLSPRTVDHHVSAILAKLGVTTRAEAVAI